MATIDVTTRCETNALTLTHTTLVYTHYTETHQSPRYRLAPIAGLKEGRRYFVTIIKFMYLRPCFIYSQMEVTFRIALVAIVKEVHCKVNMKCFLAGAISHVVTIRYSG